MFISEFFFFSKISDYCLNSNISKNKIQGENYQNIKKKNENFCCFSLSPFSFILHFLSLPFWPKKMWLHNSRHPICFRWLDLPKVLNPYFTFNNPKIFCFFWYLPSSSIINTLIFSWKIFPIYLYYFFLSVFSDYSHKINQNETLYFNFCNYTNHVCNSTNSYANIFSPPQNLCKKLTGNESFFSYVYALLGRKKTFTSYE